MSAHACARSCAWRSARSCAASSDRNASRPRLQSARSTRTDRSIARRTRRTTAGSTTKAPLAYPAPQPGVQHRTQMSLVEVLAHDPLGDLDAAPRVALAEQATAREHPVAEQRRRVLEHHDVHRIGAQARARIPDEVEALPPPGTRLHV